MNIILFVVYLVGFPIAFRIAWRDFDNELSWREHDDLMDTTIQLWMSAVAAVLWPIFAVLFGIALLVRRSRQEKS